MNKQRFFDTLHFARKVKARGTDKQIRLLEIRVYLLAWLDGYNRGTYVY